MYMFDWFEAMHLTEYINKIRLFVSVHEIILPSWILYSFPDGAWVWSMTSFQIGVWNKIEDFQSGFWILLGGALGCGGELGQVLGFVPGTFDVIDMVCMLIATVCPYYLLGNTQSIEKV